MTTSISVRHSPPLHVEIRHVAVGQPLQWLRRGWDDLRAIGLPGIAHGALIAVLGAVLLMLGSTHLYLTAAAVTGYLLVGPIMTTGLCELARRHESHESLGFDDSLQPLARHTDALTHYGGTLAVIAVLWFAVSAVLLQSVFATSAPTLAVTLWGGSATLTTQQLLAYIGCGAVLAAFVFMVSVIAVPLIIDRNATASEAIRASVRATFRSLPAMLVWAALIVVLTLLGFVTLLLGMVIVAPLLGYATWHAYRDIVA